jgi:putative DNA primase/helicase
LSDETKQQPRSAWRPVLPVPENAPPARFVHPQRGEAFKVFAYRDTEQRLLGYSCQFRRSAGGIHKLTLTWCENESDQSRAWRWIQFPALRPVYRADRLDPERHSIVLIVADEWSADELGYVERDHAGAVVDPDKWPFLSYDVVSWPGGRTKLGEVDWSCLKGRICAIWMPHSAERFKVGKGDPQLGALIPIEKQPWRVAARALKDTLTSFGAIPVALVEAETLEELPDGWDALRALNTGWDLGRLAAWVQAHFATRAELEEAQRLATAGKPAAPKVEGDWTATLKREDGVGRLLAEPHNVRLLLTNLEAWRGVIWLDEFSNKVMKAKPPPYPGGVAGEWTDFDDTMAGDYLAMHCDIRRLKSSMVGEVVHVVAKLHARNPLVDYLKACRDKWIADGRKERLKTWLADYLGAGVSEDDTAADIERLEQYHALIGRHWVKGAVARALRPGCKFDEVLILEGHQGLGKSSALAILGGEWAMDTPFSLGDKEGWEALIGAWIVEIAELDAMNKADVKTSKTFFSRRKDRFRLPFARRSQDFLRTCVFAGSTNEHEYFRDRTGNRRYLPALCRRDFNREHLERDKDFLFGEAVVAVEAGERLWLTKDEHALVRVEQRRRLRQDPWFGDLARFLASPDRAMDPSPITINRLIKEALKMDMARVDEHGHSTRIGHALAELGYDRKENKSLPERYHYVKRQGNEEGDA